MKKLAIFLALTLAIGPVYAQQYMTRTGRVTFFSATTVENIEAINNEAACALNMKNGDLSFIVPIRSFKFEKALMEDHFNDNYLESDKFPKAEFRGRIANLSTVNTSKAGEYPIQVDGKLTIHGVTHDVTIPARIVVKSGTDALVADAKFVVRCADYEVKIPSVVESKIAEEIKVAVIAQMAVTPAAANKRGGRLSVH